ncbi:TlpA family protein disulfide reductase [Geodermatophilus sp. YIM 151500]|uniref:TlpA family protein disulfide reductase n=1 Tax=Geodermatophilus sp. YIM 151500 TaxID=2984531 RepID=UPI0021E3D3EC|nr:TlpA disulfide reductase family protein [Geodermatophilus sp. YIM 151500]MCV2491037.1 TlpA family protein disulfide reductase [Geodermatophilus sp. YIM 151500]
MSGTITAATAALLVLLAGCSTEEAVDGAERPPADPDPLAAVLPPCPEQPDRPATGARTLPALALDCPAGGSLDLGRAPGVPTVVNLWGSWCGPCREELPVLQELADAAGEAVRVVGVISKDGAPQAASFATDAGVAFPSAFDGEGRLMTELGINLLPFTYFLDADGALVHTEVGPVESLDELRGLVGTHLGVRV